MPPLPAPLIAARLPARRMPRTEPPALTDDALRATMARFLASRPRGAALRLFAYGALMWEGTAMLSATARPAILHDHARQFCLHDIHSRGTPQAPGLTTGLVPRPGAACSGLVLELPEDAEALWPGWQQEMRPGFYRAAWVEAVPVPGGDALLAITFIADPSHRLWAGEMPEAAQAEVLAAAVGPLGSGAEYLRHAAEMLAAIGLPDPMLSRLSAEVARRLGG
jgi:cation transport protein ChaC